MSRTTDGRPQRQGGFTRRHFLVVSTAFVVPLVARPIRSWASLMGLPVETDDLSARLVALFHATDSARVVGLALVERSDLERSRERLVSAIAGDLGADPSRIGEATEAELREMLAARVRQDFAEDAVVDLRGWVVSRTEARLYRLVALG